MNDISSAVLDTELGAAQFTVRRPTYTVRQGITTETFHDYPASGSIQPGTPEMMELLPEEESDKPFIAIYSTFNFSTGTNPGGTTFTGADRVLFRGHMWRVVKVIDWTNLGYCKGYGVMCE